MNKNDEIMYTEFLAATIEQLGQIDEERVAEAFDRLDADQSGFITNQDLRDVLGADFPSEHIDRIMNPADTNKDGKIYWDEFLTCFRASAAAIMAGSDTESVASSFFRYTQDPSARRRISVFDDKAKNGKQKNQTATSPRHVDRLHSSSFNFASQFPNPLKALNYIDDSQDSRRRSSLLSGKNTQNPKKKSTMSTSSSISFIPKARTKTPSKSFSSRLFGSNQAKDKKPQGEEPAPPSTGAATSPKSTHAGGISMVPQIPNVAKFQQENPPRPKGRPPKPTSNTRRASRSAFL